MPAGRTFRAAPLCNISTWLLLIETDWNNRSEKRIPGHAAGAPRKPPLPPQWQILLRYVSCPARNVKKWLRPSDYTSLYGSLDIQQLVPLTNLKVSATLLSAL